VSAPAVQRVRRHRPRPEDAQVFAKLVSRRFATAYACRHNRGRVYHLHHKALYRAIGEADSRHRRPLSPDRIIHGLATLDAVLATSTTEYLATADEKAQRLPVVAHLFKDKHPVGVDPDGRVVLLYIATEACSHRFLAFLQRQQNLLRTLPTGRSGSSSPPGHSASTRPI
jgi:hypothetical protein